MSAVSREGALSRNTNQEEISVLQNLTVTTDDLWQQAVCLREGPRRIRVQEGEIELILQFDRVCLYLRDDEFPVAHLQFGGPRSGAIWFGEELIGEYDKNPAGEFVLIEISRGFKLPDSRRQEDPLAHLVSRVQRE